MWFVGETLERVRFTILDDAFQIAALRFLYKGFDTFTIRSSVKNVLNTMKIDALIKISDVGCNDV